MTVWLGANDSLRSMTGLPDRMVLGIVAAIAAAFVVFGFIVDGPQPGHARPASRSSRPGMRC